jgi:hypothetical protein
MNVDAPVASRVPVAVGRGDAINSAAGTTSCAAANPTEAFSMNSRRVSSLLGIAMYLPRTWATYVLSGHLAKRRRKAHCLLSLAS